jgi:hypothetical protein
MDRLQELQEARVPLPVKRVLQAVLLPELLLPEVVGQAITRSLMDGEGQ